MHTTLRDALDKLSDDNPHLASEFAQAVVGFSGSDQFGEMWGSHGCTVCPSHVQGDYRRQGW